MITQIAFVSHPTRNMAASKKFFGDLLGLKLTMRHEDKWCEFDTPDGKSIALDTFSPPDKGPYLALETDNIEKEMARLRKRGVPVALDIMDNKVCKMASVHDPNGHAVMPHQMEPGRLKALNAAKAGGKADAKAQAKAKSKPAAKPPAKAKPAAVKAKPAAAKAPAGVQAKPVVTQRKPASKARRSR